MAAEKAPQARDQGLIGWVVIAIAPQGQHAPHLAIEFIKRALLFHDFVIRRQATGERHLQGFLANRSKVAVQFSAGREVIPGRHHRRVMERTLVTPAGDLTPEAVVPGGPAQQFLPHSRRSIGRKHRTQN